MCQGLVPPVISAIPSDGRHPDQASLSPELWGEVGARQATGSSCVGGSVPHSHQGPQSGSAQLLCFDFILSASWSEVVSLPRG